MRFYQKVIKLPTKDSNKHIFSSFMISFLTKNPEIVESNVLGFKTIDAFFIVACLKMIHFSAFHGILTITLTSKDLVLTPNESKEVKMCQI